MQKPILVLHIGYAKTASTYLQTSVYPFNKNIKYFGRVYLTESPNSRNENSAGTVSLDSNQPIEQFASDILHLDDKLYKQKDYPQFWKARCDDTKINLMSHENLLRPHDQTRLFERLRTLQGDFEIRLIVTIREQFDAIWSRYVHDNRLGLFSDYTLEDALALGKSVDCYWPNCVKGAKQKNCPCIDRKTKAISTRYYDYSDLYHRIAAYFDGESVLFLPYERIRDSADEFVRDLYAFIDPTGDTAVAQQSMRYRAVNVQPVEQSEQLLKLNAPTLDRIKYQLKNQFAKSNQSLSQVLGISLRHYNYIVSST